MKILSINIYNNYQTYKNQSNSKNTYQKTDNSPNFGVIKPEHMFINTKGFSKDKDWAKNVIRIINSGKNLVKENTKFEDLINFVTKKYHAYYKSFGPFLGNDFFGTKRFFITDNILCNKYEPYKERAKELVDKNSTNNSYKMCAYLPSQKMVAELTKIEIKKSADGSYESYAIAPDINMIDPVMNEVAEIYKELLDEKDFGKITNSVAQIHWLISQVRPYTRGSAGVADMLSKIIFEAKDIQVSPYKKDVNPNLEAFVMPLDEYCEKYTSFFSEPLRKISGEAVK